MRMKRIQCRKVRRILLEWPTGQMPERQRALVEGHLRVCPACVGYSQRLERFEIELAFACSEAPAWTTRPAAPRVTVGKGKVALGALAFAACAIFGANYGRTTGVKGLFPVAEADPIGDQVQGLSGLGFEGRSDSWRQSIGGSSQPVEMWESDRDTSNFASFDTAIARTGEQSLRLPLRAEGGSVRSIIPGPFPAGTTLTLRAYVYMPQPGSYENKWLTITAGYLDPASKSHSTHLSIFDAAPHWRPYTLMREIETKAASVVVGMSTGSGLGLYKGNDRAAWIDDVEICIRVPFESAIEVGADLLRVRIKPAFTTPGEFDVDSLTLGVYGQRRRHKPQRTRVDNGTLVAEFDVPGLQGLIAAGNPDVKGKPLTADLQSDIVRGRLRFAAYSPITLERAVPQK